MFQNTSLRVFCVLQNVIKIFDFNKKPKKSTKSTSDLNRALNINKETKLCFNEEIESKEKHNCLSLQGLTVVKLPFG